MPNIEKRKNGWYATLHIPSDVRLTLGKAKFFQSLKTTDKRTAEARAAVVVAKWKDEIQQARGKTGDPFIAAAMEWRRDIARSANAEVLESVLLDHVEREIEPVHGYAAAKTFHEIAVGNRRALASVIPEWKASLTLAQKTIDQMEKDVGRMVKKFPTVEGMDRKSVRGWLDDLARGDEKLSPSSITRIVGFCRNFYRYLQEIEEVPREGETPFVIPSFAKPPKKAKSATGNGWIPFTPADVVRLHGEALRKDDQQLADLILLGSYTGARIEELCSLKVSEVGPTSFIIIDAKTAAGNREVPIHSSLMETVERLKKTRRLDRKTGRDDGYLLSGLTFNKYGDRSNAIGKRFGRLKGAMGYGDSHVFHSIRKTVVTMLENAGVSENLTADIVGHDKPRITYGLYSGGASLDVKRTAIELLQYPPATGCNDPL